MPFSSQTDSRFRVLFEKGVSDFRELETSTFLNQTKKKSGSMNSDGSTSNSSREGIKFYMREF